MNPIPLLLLLFTCAEARTVERTVQVGPLERTYRLFVPPGASRPAPLVLALHGGGSNSRQMERSCRFNALARKEGFVVAYPESGTKHWNDSRGGDFDSAHRENRDDVGFLAALIDAVDKEHPVDRRRVYLTGISNGGFMSHAFAAAHPERTAAIAPVVAGIGVQLAKSFAPKEPVSVLIIQGTEDKLVPYSGGAIAGGRGALVHTDEALALWRKANGCTGEPKVDSLPDRDPKDGCKVVRTVWSGCQNKTEVVFLKLVGGGHTWPDGKQYLPKRIIGGVCRDFDDALIWEFFKAHPKAAP